MGWEVAARSRRPLGPRPAGRKEQVEREYRREAGSRGDDSAEVLCEIRASSERKEKTEKQRRDAAKAFRLACLRATIFMLAFVCQLTVSSPDAWDSLGTMEPILGLHS